MYRLFPCCWHGMFFLIIGPITLFQFCLLVCCLLSSPRARTYIHTLYAFYLSAASASKTDKTEEPVPKEFAHTQTQTQTQTQTYAHPSRAQTQAEVTHPASTEVPTTCHAPCSRIYFRPNKPCLPSVSMARIRNRFSSSPSRATYVDISLVS